MAEIIILHEKKCKNVTHDGMLKEILEEAAHLCSHLLSVISIWDEEESPKDSPGLKEEKSTKDSSGWEEKAKKVAASEQNTSKGKDRSNSLPRSNKIRKRKTCSNKFAVIEPKYIYRLIVYLILIGTLVSGANGEVEVEQKPYRYMSVATDETKVVTNPVRTLHSYSILARGGNYPGTYKCTPDFVENNPSCSIVNGDNNQTECEGLRISGNETHTHLVVDGSKLTYDHTTFCILERVPNSFILYTLGVSKKQDQDIAQQESPGNITKVTNQTIDATEPVPTPAPKTNLYEVAFYILLSIVLVILMVIAIAIKKNFPYMPRIRAWWKKESMKQVPTNDHDQDQNTTALEDLDRRNDSVA